MQIKLRQGLSLQSGRFMQSALFASAFVMGLAGGPHCVAMCGAACAAVGHATRPPAVGVATLSRIDRVARTAAPMPLVLQAGRLAGYAAGGAIAAGAMQGLAAGSAHVQALQPLWVMLHAVVLAWGLILAALGRQPVWALRAGSAIARSTRPLTRSVSGVFALGTLWVALPCGLLYSALMLAALANGPVQGALAMTLFAFGSGLSLWLAPWLVQRAGWRIGALRQQLGTRLAGVLLVLLALEALHLDVVHQIAIWCA